MNTKSISELRKTLADTLDQVVDDHEPVFITRGKGKPTAVLMSLEDFASYEETRYLMRSPKNAKRLMKAIEDLENGGGEVRELIE
jgi:antitoxin YefM